MLIAPSMFGYAFSVGTVARGIDCFRQQMQRCNAGVLRAWLAGGGEGPSNIDIRLPAREMARSQLRVGCAGLCRVEPACVAGNIAVHKHGEVTNYIAYNGPLDRLPRRAEWISRRGKVSAVTQPDCPGARSNEK